jgi:cytoskeleton protein RodZ
VNEEFDASLQDVPPKVTAGMHLRDARLAAGWSIDAVAQQLKLAPRQVQALEDDDFGQLPGRTFVRGFVRNYARLMQLDTDEVLAALPDAVAAPSLDSPSLAPSPRVMGELPAYLHAKPSSARWLIPLVLTLIFALGVAYEYTRPGSTLRGLIHGESTGSSTAAPGSPVAPSSADAAQALPNPVASVTGGTPLANASHEPAPATADASPAAGTPPGDGPLVLVFRGTSWVEVKDGNGAIVLSTIGYPGASHTVGGAPPFDVVLGNAEAVTVTYRGLAVDNTPYIKQNVAKFTLK